VILCTKIFPVFREENAHFLKFQIAITKKKNKKRIAKNTKMRLGADMGKTGRNSLRFFGNVGNFLPIDTV
jgi:hypothetical protein